MRLTLPDAGPEGDIDLRTATFRELQKILASEGFAKAERMRRFLTYAVERTLEHDLAQLKESVIGVEVFDRPPSYDPKSDPIVRIEARRLREKLRVYYERDGPDDPVRIDLPKGGYVASIEILTVPEPAPLAQPPADAAPETPLPVDIEPPAPPVDPVVLPPPPRATPWRLIALVSAAAVVVVAAIVLWRWVVRDRAVTPLAVQTFTTLPGAETEPAFSADGSKIAFVWTGPDKGQPNIYVQSVDRFTPVVVTTEAEGDVSSPVWSPDGREIAFLRPTGLNQIGLFSINLATRHVRQRGQVESVPYPIGPGVSLDWSPDGRYFVTTHRRNLVLLSTETGEMKQLTTTPERTLGHYDPVFSPDGRQVAFREAASFGVSDIYVVSVAGGTPRRVTYSNVTLYGQTWSADGKDIIFALQRSLWRVSAKGGQPRRLTDGTVSALRPRISRAGGRLVFAGSRSASRIWRMPLNRQGKPEQLLASTLSDLSPDISPDGRRIAFRSHRTGSAEIWTAATDGGVLHRLTSFGKPLTGCPRWSPDGKYLAFDSRPHGKSDIFLVNADTGRLRHFTTDENDEVVPSWSRDGRFVYFASDRTGTWQIWKQSVDDDRAIQVTWGGGFGAFESPDGKFVYYAKDRSGYGLWRVPVNGGREEEVVADLQPGMWGNWRLSTHKLVFADADPPYRIHSLDLRTMHRSEVGRLPLEPLVGDTGMALSPDGEWLYMALADPLASDLFLVEQFK